MSIPHHPPHHPSPTPLSDGNSEPLAVEHASGPTRAESLIPDSDRYQVELHLHTDPAVVYRLGVVVGEVRSLSVKFPPLPEGAQWSIIFVPVEER